MTYKDTITPAPIMTAIKNASIKKTVPEIVLPTRKSLIEFMIGMPGTKTTIVEIMAVSKL